MQKTLFKNELKGRLTDFSEVNEHKHKQMLLELLQTGETEIYNCSAFILNTEKSKKMYKEISFQKIKNTILFNEENKGELIQFYFSW